MSQFLIPQGTASAVQHIDNNNWAADFPYAPKVDFTIHHDSEKLYLHFDVEEQYTKAEVDCNNGEVWTDSCVEFFISFDDRGYYNFEMTCIGQMLLAFRKTKPEPTYASDEVMASVKRVSTLGSECFAERVGDNKWSMDVEIPRTAFFAHQFETLSGIEATANVYKCGDNLSKPHFLSWNKIDTPTPNFHVPEFFAGVKFE
ncbi:MAG: carbohydrate-binding family 9-like protein [Rikenellaceae bacterium]